MNPRILLVEDDPVSRAFLAAAAEGVPARVASVATCADAVHSEREAASDLWLIDANLPDGSGASLLACLRADADATPALAHTASRDPSDHRALHAAGFAEVLVKPLSMEALQVAIRRTLGARVVVADDGSPSYAQWPAWDDAAALSALKGEQSHVAALRRLFLDELAGQLRAIDRARADGDMAAIRGVLHRMRASCGFVGAAQLGEAARQLENDPGSVALFDGFRAAADALVAIDHSA